MAKRTYKASSPRSKEILAEKRRAAKILREAGLLRRRAGKITTSYLRESSYFRKLRREFADVIAGETRAAKINLDAARLFRSAGYRVKRAPGGAARVIVPKAAPRRIIPSMALQPPPAAPVVARRARPRAARRVDQITEQVVDWFRAHGGREDRIDTLMTLIAEQPKLIYQILEISKADQELYLHGRPQRHQTELPEGDTEKEQEFTDLLREEFPEIYYYHGSAASYFSPGMVRAA